MTWWLLDTYCGPGGASMGYHRAGFTVVGVDKDPQPSYPFEFHQRDAIEALQDPEFMARFHAATGSPPCQSYSKAMRHLAAPQPMLIDATRAAMESTGLHWVIENVPGSPIPHQPTLDGDYGVELCGTMFGKRFYRHRLFLSSFPLYPPRGCDHSQPAMNPHNVQGRERMFAEFGKDDPERHWRHEMDVDWAKFFEAREMIPPCYTGWIGKALRAELEVRV